MHWASPYELPYDGMARWLSARSLCDKEDKEGDTIGDLAEMKSRRFSLLHGQNKQMQAGSATC